MKKNLRYFLIRWLPAAAILAAIFIFSSIPSNRMPDLGFLDTLVKKTGHMLGYFLLFLAFQRGIRSQLTQGRWISLGLIVVYALTDEFHQSFTPGRNATLVDVGIDTLGGMLGWLASRYAVVRRIVNFSL